MTIIPNFGLGPFLSSLSASKISGMAKPLTSTQGELNYILLCPSSLPPKNQENDQALAGSIRLQMVCTGPDMVDRKLIQKDLH